MMALSGVRISWLILARNSDLAVEAFSACLLGVDQLFLGALPGGDVAHHRAEFLAVGDPPHGEVKRHQAALPHQADRLAAGVEHAGAVRQPVEIIEHGAPAFRREQVAETELGDFGRLVAEQRLGAAVGREHAAGAIEHQHAVGGGVEDRLELVVFAFQPAQRSAALPRSSATACVLIISTSAFSLFQATLNRRPSTGFCLPLTVVMVSVLPPFLGFAGGRLGLGVDEQAVEAAGLGQRFQRGVAGPVEEGAVGVDQRVEAIDQDADRQAVEDRPPFMRYRGRHRRCARPAALPARHRRRRGRNRPAAGAAALLPAVLLSRALSSRASSSKALRSPGLSAGGSSAGGGERQHIVRRRFRFDLGRRGRCLRPALLQRGQAIDVAADAEAAIAGKLAVAVEHRQARHLDRQGLIRIVDRPGHDDAAPGGARGERVRHGALRIELERGGDIRPRAVEHGGGLRPEQLGEIFRAEGEAVRRIHLPDEAERKAARAQVPAQPDRNGGAACVTAAVSAPAACSGAAKAASSVTVAPAPRRSRVAGQAAMSPSARPLSEASRASCSAPSAIRSRLVAEALARRRHGLDQFAIGGENRRRPLEIREQPLRAVGQAKVFAGALGRNHQHGGTVVGERDARAKTDQRAAEAGAESAQPFQPRRAALRQRAGQAQRSARRPRARARSGWRPARPARRHRRSRPRSDWPTARASRPRSRAIPASGSGHGPRAADRSGKRIGIRSHSSRTSHCLRLMNP